MPEPSGKSSNDPTYAGPRLLPVDGDDSSAGSGAAGSAAPSGSGDKISADQAAPGQRIAKYQIIRLLGKGGMGVVYEALDVVLHRKVALKILPREFSDNEQALKRFIREARAAARLNHPNAVAVYDIGRKDAICYIAMELVNGESVERLLSDRLVATQKGLDYLEATRWIADACRALIAAHDAGLIHRDIKPGNLLRGESGAIKVSDFGLAKPMDAQNVTLTQRDAFVGTPLYMSPEQCRNENVDHRTDIYSLGATYYTLLSGEPPYSKGSSLQILFAHCSAPIPDVRERCGETHPLCAQIIRRAMAKDPAERYQSAREMLADLEAVLGQDPAGDPFVSAMQGLLPAGEQVDVAREQADQPAVWQPTPASARRRKRRVIFGIAAGGAAVVIAIIVAIVAAARGPAGAEDSQRVVATPGQSRESPVTVIPPPEAPAPPAAEAMPRPEEPAPAPAQPAEQLRPWRDAGHVPLFKQFTSPQPLAQAEQGPPPADAAVAPPAQPPAEPVDPRAGANDPALRDFESAKKWLAVAATRENKVLVTNGARAMMLWHDFFAKSPHAFHKPAADEAKALAEEHVPGISDRPRITPPAGPPMPPQQLQPPPQDRDASPPADRPDPGDRPRLPQRRGERPPPR